MFGEWGGKFGNVWPGFGKTQIAAALSLICVAVARDSGEARFNSKAARSSPGWINVSGAEAKTLNLLCVGALLREPTTNRRGKENS